MPVILGLETRYARALSPDTTANRAPFRTSSHGIVQVLPSGNNAKSAHISAGIEHTKANCVFTGGRHR